MFKSFIEQGQKYWRFLIAFMGWEKIPQHFGLRRQRNRFLNKVQFMRYKQLSIMSRCQHGQVISLFCLSDSCTWREAGGCPICFKKYHAHSTSVDTITEQQLEEIQKKLTVKPDLKNKSRPLQEAVYNYFMIMKSQISSSLDVVSRGITNRLNYSYLSAEGQLPVYKKIKNREYKKISKKQLKSFYQFAKELTNQELEQQQKRIYYEEVSNTAKAIEKINSAFSIYYEAVSYLDSSFNIESSFYEKIFEICSSVTNTEMVPTNVPFKSKTSAPSSHKIDKINEKVEQVLKTKQSNRDRDRKVSIDITDTLEPNRFKSPTISYDDNEKEILERKKKLFDLMNNPKKSVDSIKVEISSHSMQQSSKTQPTKTQVKSQQSQVKEGDKTQEVKMTSISKKLEKQTESFQGSANLEIDKECSNLFTSLISQGINIPEMIVHTLLPREASKTKLYEDTRDVKQRKVTIPMKKFEQIDEVSSPILKKKRKQNKDQELKLFKVQSSAEESALDNVAVIETPKIEEPQKNEELMLKEKQADSLALLVQSLPLSAEKAIPLLQAALKFAHNNLSAAEYLSYLYLYIGEPKQCLDLCNEILEQLEDSPQINELSIHIRNNKAAALNALGRYSESISILEKCLEYAKREIYYKNLGDAYFSISIYEKAALNYEEALALNDNLDEAHYNLAVCYYLQDYLNEAKLHADRAREINKKVPAYEQLQREILTKLKA